MASSNGSDHFEWGARLGYGARGLVYLIVGWLAFLAAFGQGGETTDTKGSLREILQQPAGEVLLGLVAVALVGYSVWRILQGVLDADRHGRSAKALVIRGGLLVSALLHLSLAFFAVSLIFGWGSGGSGSDDWTARLLAARSGRWLAFLAGAAVIGAGMAQIWKGWRGTFRRRLAVTTDIMRWAGPVSRFGLAARGIVFFIVGGFLMLAAWQYDASKARGLDGALEALQRQPFGPYLLAVVALGLMAFGIYSMVEAVYRRIGIPDAVESPLGAKS